jgi:hypothetical protein
MRTAIAFSEFGVDRSQAARVAFSSRKSHLQMLLKGRYVFRKCSRNITVAVDPGHQHFQPRAGKKQNRSVRLYVPVNYILSATCNRVTGSRTG